MKFLEAVGVMRTVCGWMTVRAHQKLDERKAIFVSGNLTQDFNDTEKSVFFFRMLRFGRHVTENVCHRRGFHTCHFPERC